MDCCLCPNPEEIPLYPPLTQDIEHPMATLRCSHQAHTHCLVNRMIISRAEVFCKLCEVDAINPGTREFYDYHNFRDVREREQANNIERLWRESDEFRKDVKDCKKRLLAYKKEGVVFSKASAVIKRNFLENIQTSIALIKDQKRVATQEFKRIPSRRGFLSKGNSFHRKLNQMRAIYGLRYLELRDGLRRCQGAPKFPYRSTLYCRWKFNPTYFFRTRI